MKVLKTYFESVIKPLKTYWKRTLMFLIVTTMFLYIYMIIQDGFIGSFTGETARLIAILIIAVIMDFFFYIIYSTTIFLIDKSMSFAVILGFVFLIGLVTILYILITAIVEFVLGLFGILVTEYEIRTIITFIGIVLSVSTPIIITIYTLNKSKLDNEKSYRLRYLPFVKIDVDKRLMNGTEYKFLDININKSRFFIPEEHKYIFKLTNPTENIVREVKIEEIDVVMFPDDNSNNFYIIENINQLFENKNEDISLVKNESFYIDFKIGIPIKSELEEQFATKIHKKLTIHIFYVFIFTDILNNEYRQTFCSDIDFIIYKGTKAKVSGKYVIEVGEFATIEYAKKTDSFLGSMELVNDINN